jgi:hypothetical protein
VAPLAQKLLTCYSAMGDVERVHKVTSRHRTKNSNRKLDSTTEAYCDIAIAESNTKRRELSDSRGQNVMHAFRSRMRAAVRARKEHQAAAQAIDEARAEVGGVAGGSDDDAAPSNGFDGILNEVCEETGLVSDVSDEEAW